MTEQLTRKPRLEWLSADLESGVSVLETYSGGYRLTVYLPSDDDDESACWTIDAIRSLEGRDVARAADDVGESVIDAQIAAEDAALILLRDAIAALEPEPAPQPEFNWDRSFTGSI